ncbi:hypothetical protein EV652_12187 [Kribbella steppae]|uniref:Uncharacterized protein n=2 Tax=Kribbella steppae TaxID=2512223 RepID=A0A4R2GXH4_9ACTN|nr:hypothetical protein EV652_12187 [Kribbella steppae]
MQIRIPLDSSYPSYIEPMLDEFAVRLDGETEFCDDQEGEGDEVCFYLYGPNQDRLIEVALTAPAKFSLFDGAYAVKTAQRHEATGERERVST